MTADEQTTGPVWRDRGTIIANQQARIAELEAACQRLRDDYQGALAEVQGLKRDVAGQTRSAQNGWRTADTMRDRAEAAEADAAGLRARMLRLADEWDEYNEGSESWRIFGPQVVSVPYAVKCLRAALTAPAEDTTPEPAPADGQNAADLSDAIRHVECAGDTGTSHTLHPRQYVVRCEWCPETFFGPTKAKAMEAFRRHERERLDTGGAAIAARLKATRTREAGWGTNGWPVVVSRPTPAAEPQAEDTTPTEQHAQGGA